MVGWFHQWILWGRRNFNPYILPRRWTETIQFVQILRYNSVQSILTAALNLATLLTTHANHSSHYTLLIYTTHLTTYTLSLFSHHTHYILFMHTSPHFTHYSSRPHHTPLFAAIGRTLIPRYFRSVFEGGVTEMQVCLKHAKESLYGQHTVALECDNASIITQHGKPYYTKVHSFTIIFNVHFYNI